MPNPIQLLAIELCELNPVELDAFCQDFAVKLPMSDRTIARMTAIAEYVLQHESLGDALIRIDRYRQA